MGLIGTKERLVRNVVRLRRAERASPAADEIATVRADLERAVGPTVSRAMAARLLGVSQMALDRWIGSGDIPAVISPAGRREVPRGRLVDLIEAVEERRSAGDRHPLASVLHQSRAGAERLDIRAILPSHYRRRTGEGHRGPELRSLAYHRVVAQRLDERVVRDARERLCRWRGERRIDPRYADRWDEILSLPPAQIANRISRDTQEARDLRQNSPFAGALTERERQRVLEATRATAR